MYEGAMRNTHDCFIGGDAGALTLDVIVIRPITITAVAAVAAVELCVTLPVDVVQATAPPINDHDSVLRRPRQARLHRTQRVQFDPATNRRTVIPRAALVGKYGRRVVRMTKSVDLAYGEDIGRDRFTIALTASRGCHHGRRANVVRGNDVAAG